MLAAVPLSFLVEVVFTLVDPFFEVALLAAAAFLEDGGSLMTLALPGVTVVVQYHLPLASDHETPSLAFSYTALADRLLPKGSSSLAWPAVLLRLNLVSSEKNAVKLCAGMLVPVGKV